MTKFVVMWRLCNTCKNFINHVWRFGGGDPIFYFDVLHNEVNNESKRMKITKSLCEVVGIGNFDL